MMIKQWKYLSILSTIQHLHFINFISISQIRLVNEKYGLAEAV